MENNKNYGEIKIRLIYDLGKELYKKTFYENLNILNYYFVMDDLKQMHQDLVTEIDKFDVYKKYLKKLGLSKLKEIQEKIK